MSRTYCTTDNKVDFDLNIYESMGCSKELAECVGIVIICEFSSLLHAATRLQRFGAHKVTERGHRVLRDTRIHGALKFPTLC